MNLKYETATLLERLGRLAMNDRMAGGLNPVQWEAVRYFSRANRFSRTPSGLTAYLGVSKGSVSQTIVALERKALISKARNPSNRRSVDIELTAAGRRLLESDPLEKMEQDLAALNIADLNSLHRVLSKLIRQALRTRDGLPFGVCSTCEHFRERHSAGNPHYCALLGEPLTAADSSLICREHHA